MQLSISASCRVPDSDHINSLPNNVQPPINNGNVHVPRQTIPLSMSGRHPDGKGKLVPMHFAMMALAGSPDGKAEYDSEMAF